MNYQNIELNNYKNLLNVSEKTLIQIENNNKIQETIQIHKMQIELFNAKETITLDRKSERFVLALDMIDDSFLWVIEDIFK